MCFYVVLIIFWELLLLLGELLCRSSVPRFFVFILHPLLPHVLTWYKYRSFVIPCHSAVPIMDCSSDRDDNKKDTCNNNFIGRQHEKFKRASDKKTHQKSCDCLKCHRSFPTKKRTKKRLNNYQRSCDEVKAVYSCPVCDKAFTWLDNQQRHTRTCPSRKRKCVSSSSYTCRCCGEVFSNRADLYQYVTNQR